MIVKCPTNCEHEYEFAHSIVTTSRLVHKNGVPYQETTKYVVCRECGHWIDGQAVCNCRSLCHEYPNGTLVVSFALEGVN